MAGTTVPPGVKSKGNIGVWWVDTIADISAPKVAELTSATAAMFIACYLTEHKPPALDQGTETDERFCTATVFETFGDEKWTFDKLKFVVDPQNPTSDTEKAYKMLTEYKRGYLVYRWGKQSTEPLAQGDIVNIHPVQLGRAVETPAEGNKPMVAEQTIIPIAEPALRKAVTA